MGAPEAGGPVAGWPDTDQARRHLRSLLREMGQVLVAFSGGVDSALVAAVAREELGDGALALTAASATMPDEEAQVAARVAAALGLQHLKVDSHELEREAYAANTGDRCYHCKTELFDLAVAEARRRGIRWVVDGTIQDDLGEHRPGLQAAREHDVRHPLVEAGFDKVMVRAWARELGLEVWDKPSFACLGSRFPVGSRVTADRVGRLGRIERHLRALGVRQFRARWVDQGPSVRIEVAPEELELIVRAGVREAIVDTCKAEGFRWVSLDLEGYRRGGTSLPASDGATEP